jgi:uncharacterized repeat protein (TIGR04076 family)
VNEGGGKMTNGKLDERTKKLFKSRMGYDDEQMKMIEENPKQREIIEGGAAFVTKKLVSTCIEAENCTYNKVGDRYVFNSFGGMIKDQTCETPCLLALSCFLPFLYMVYDRIASGLDPNGMHLDHVSCPDTGCRYGGFGTAMFKISIEDV